LEQNTGQNREIEIGNRPFENVSQFKYLGTTVADQNLIQEEIKRLRRKFGTKRDGVTGGWRKLLNEELHNLYSSSSIIIVEDEVGGTCGTNGRKEEPV
jgi:hypothetical protein